MEMVMEARADAILVGGDFISTVEGIPAATEEIARLGAPYGVFACLGNHDHWTAPESVAEAPTGAGVNVLRNRAISLREGLWLAGVDDVWEEQDDLDTALEGVPGGAATILLAHEPDFADRAAEDGRVALQLSGHSHGGQVRLPIIGPPILPYLGERYSAGLYEVGEMQLYVTRGVGVIAPPVRFNCRPEVTIITLTS
jgi:predicted MPP superfamily phosphohydrolase